jgi:molybdenum cofactor cytidylyltransferase
MVYWELPLERNDQPIAALILAAGLSSRMKTMKQLLPLEGQTVIERVISLFWGIDIRDILVVLGYAADQLIPIVNKQGVSYVVNDNYQSGMFSSICKGAGHLVDRGCGAFFIMPADMPFVKKETLQELIRAFRKTGKAAYRPQYQGRRGHPPLISTALIPAILTFKDEGGLRALLATCEENCADVACDDPGILIDLDTPGDYQKHRLPERSNENYV